MTVATSWSISRRLSIWLMVQTFIGLALVSAVVYVVTGTVLATRQSEEMGQKQALIIHLLDEARRDRDMPALNHKLADFFAGHPDLTLQLLSADGAQIYRNAPAPAAATRTRTVTFTSPPMPGAGGAAITARLVLDPQADDELLRRLLATLVAAALVGALAASAGGFLLVRLGLAPVQNLVNQAAALNAQTLGRRLDGSAQPRELQPLVVQFNALLERLEAAYAHLEGFNADVAHELNTPLATLITSTELALRKKREPDALRDILGSNLEDLHRMSDIITDMLFLANAERGAEVRATVVASLARVAADVVEYHEAALSEAQLVVEISGDAHGEFDVPLVKRAISNLLSNATRYGEPGSSIRIEIRLDVNKHLRLAVVNQGQPVAAADLPRIFDRFYRADPSRSESHLTHGLGLSIVAAIARMHRGTTFAQSSGGQTSIGFTVPVAA